MTATVTLTVAPALLLAGLARSCPAQFPTDASAGWQITVSDGVTPSRPTATVEVAARMHYGTGPFLAFGRGDFDIAASDGEFTDPRWLAGPIEFWRIGVPQGGRVAGVYAWQPGLPHVPNASNPFRFWAVTWRTGDFTRRRRVTLRTENTTQFKLLIGPIWYEAPVPDAQFFPGHAEVFVDLDCFPDCDTSTGVGVLDSFDFLCFSARFAAMAPYACSCDTSTGPGVCDIFDFLCFQNEFVAGCP